MHPDSGTNPYRQMVRRLYEISGNTNNLTNQYATPYEEYLGPNHLEPLNTPEKE